MKKTFSLFLSVFLVWASAGPDLLLAASGAAAPVKGPGSRLVFPLPGNLPLTPANFYQAFLALSPKERLQVLPEFAATIRKNPKVLKKASWKGYEEAQEILSGLTEQLEGSRPSSEKLQEGSERLLAVLQKSSPVPLKTDADKLSFLLNLSERIPGLFKDAVTYDHDLFELLEKQREIQEKLGKMKSYQKLSLEAEAPPRLQIEVSAGEGRKVVSKSINAEAFQKWKEELAETLDALSKVKGRPRPERPRPAGPRPVVWEGGELDAPIKQALQERISALSFSVSGFMAGLLNALSPEKRREISASWKEQKLPIEEKLKTLERELPEELVSRGFKPGPYGLRTDRLEKKEALDLLKSNLASQEEFRKLAEFYLLLENPDGNIPDSRENLLARIRNTGEAQLDFFKDPKALSERFEKMLSSSELVLDEKTKEAVLKAVQKRIKVIASTTVEKVTELAGSLLLEEVGPLVGIFRGFAGDDCSTQYSFAYANSPMERVFFVYDASRRLKGYAAATLVKAGERSILRPRSFKGKNALYLHTINGKRISAGDVQLILGGLAQALGHFGAEALIMPTRVKINNFVNFFEIEDALMTQPLDRERAGMDLRYLDNPVRKALSAYSNAGYDKAESNEAGLKLDLEAHKGVSAKIQVLPPETYPRKEISKEEALWLALDFESANRESQARRLMKAVQVDTQKFALIAGALTPPSNEARMDAIKESGLKITWEDIRKRKPELFYRGWFGAPDAMSDRWADTTIGYLKEISEDGPSWKYAKKFINKHPDQFRKQAGRLKDWAVSLYENEKENREKFKALRQTGVLRLMKEELTAAALSIEDHFERWMRLMGLDEDFLISQKALRSDPKRAAEALLWGFKRGEENKFSTLPTVHFVRRNRFVNPEIVSALKGLSAFNFKNIGNDHARVVRSWSRIALAQNGIREEYDEWRLFEIIQSKEIGAPSFGDGPVIEVEAAKALKNLGLSKEEILPLFEKRYPEAFQYDRTLSIYEKGEQLVALHLLLAVSDKDKEILEKIARFALHAGGDAQIAAFMALIEENFQFPYPEAVLSRFAESVGDTFDFDDALEGERIELRREAIERLGGLAFKNPLAREALETLSREIGDNSELKPALENALGKGRVETALNTVQALSLVEGESK